MIALIKEEFKKVFKSKMNFVLIFLLFGYTVWITNSVYHPSFNDYFFVKEEDGVSSYNVTDKSRYQTMDGVDLDGLDYLKYKDEKLHEFAGKPSKELLKKYESNYISLAESDVAKSNRKYSATINDVYYNYFETGDIRDVEDVDLFQYRELSSLVQFQEKENIHNYAKELVAYQQSYEKNEIKLFEKDIESKMSSSISSFDSNIPNNMLTKALTRVNFTTLIVIVIILANLFSIEQQRKTDQILMPTRSGSKKLTSAKLITGVGIALGITCLQLIIVFIMSRIYLPIRTLDLIASSAFELGIGEYLFSYSKIITTALILILLASLVTVFMTMCISYISKNRFVTTVVMFFITVIPEMLSIPYILSIFMPARFMRFDQFFSYSSELNLPYPAFIFGDGVVSVQNVVIIAWILLLPVLLIVLMKHSKKHIAYSK